jgi:hypothetical protein
MDRPLSRLSYPLLASTFVLSAIAVAEPPAAPAPVPVPYTNATARDATSGLPTGKRMHKPFTLSAPARDAASTAAQAASCAPTNVQPSNVASDPEEGGQVSGNAAKAKPMISDFHIMKRSDKSSATLFKTAPSGSPACAPVEH